MFNIKLFLILALACYQCHGQADETFDAEWQVLVNLLGTEGLEQSPDTVASSLWTIIRGLFPRTTQRPATQRPTPAPTAAPTAAPTPAPTQASPQPIVISLPTPPATTPAPQPLPFPWSYYLPYILQLLQQSQKPDSISIPVPPQVSCNLPNHSSEECECKKKNKALADFQVNVPCKKSTPKPPKKIVLKVPCATTSTTTEQPCKCQCCPCNPCSKPKHTKKIYKKKESCEGSSSESRESREFRTIYRAYDAQKQNEIRPRIHLRVDESSEEAK